MSDRVGLGFDAHRFSDEPRALVLGGVKFDAAKGLIGHSDADVITHAVIDALLGAAQLGDMGDHFPDTDPAWKDADSIDMLEEAVRLAEKQGYVVNNVDCSVVIDEPHLASYRESMQARLTDAIGAPVSVKAKRSEGLGALKGDEGVTCWAVALLSSTKS